MEKLQAEEPGLSDKISVSIGINKKAVIVYSDMVKHIRENDRLSLLEDKIALNELHTEIAAGEGKSGFDTLDLDAERNILNYLNAFKIEEINEQASVKAENAVILLLGYPAVLTVMIAVVLCADIISSEFDIKTCYLLFTQPMKKSKLFLSKIISAFLFTGSFYSLFFILLYFIMTVIKGRLPYNYPYIYYNGASSVIPAVRFLMLSFILLFLLLSFVISLTFFISSLLKNTPTAISAATVLIFLLYLLSSGGLLGGAAHLSPFSYLNITSVINGTTSRLYGDARITFTNGIAVLILSILVFLISGIVILKNNTRNL